MSLRSAGAIARVCARHYSGVLLLVIVSGLGVAAYHPEGYITAYFFTGERLATGRRAFADPEVCEYCEDERVTHFIRLPANAVLNRLRWDKTRCRRFAANQALWLIGVLA
jgi:hypothetical protein